MRLQLLEMRAKEVCCWIGENSCGLRVPEVSWVFSHCIEESLPVFNTSVDVDTEKPGLDDSIDFSGVEGADSTDSCNGTSGRASWGVSLRAGTAGLRDAIVACS